MTRGVTTRDQATGARPRRRSNAGAVMFLLLITIGLVGVLGVGFLAPSRLALVQEQVLRVIHGGIVDTTEETIVEGCLRLEGYDTPQAVTRTVRTVTFGDGTSLTITFTSRPAPTNMACN